MSKYKGRIDLGFVTRGAEVEVWDGFKNVWRRGFVVTHIRNGRWAINVPTRPVGDKRVILSADQLRPAPVQVAPVRAPRSPIERMVDAACGVRDTR